MTHWKLAVAPWARISSRSLSWISQCPGGRLAAPATGGMNSSTSAHSAANAARTAAAMSQSRAVRRVMTSMMPAAPLCDWEHFGERAVLHDGARGCRRLLGLDVERPGNADDEQAVDLGDPVRAARARDHCGVDRAAERGEVGRAYGGG